METIEALSARIETTQDIQSIVRTMKSLSAVSIRQYESAVTALSDYARAVELGLQAVLRNEGVATAAREPEDGNHAAVVIGSDRGLCGRFNERISDFVSRHIGERSQQRQETTRILAIGERAAARLDAVGRTPDEI